MNIRHKNVLTGVSCRLLCPHKLFVSPTCFVAYFLVPQDMSRREPKIGQKEPRETMEANLLDMNPEIGETQETRGRSR